MTYEGFTGHNVSPSSELAGNSEPDCEVRLLASCEARLSERLDEIKGQTSP